MMAGPPLLIFFSGALRVVAFLFSAFVKDRRRVVADSTS